MKEGDCGEEGDGSGDVLLSDDVSRLNQLCMYKPCELLESSWKGPSESNAVDVNWGKRRETKDRLDVHFFGHPARVVVPGTYGG